MLDRLLLAALAFAPFVLFVAVTVIRRRRRRRIPLHHQGGKMVIEM